MNVADMPTIPVDFTLYLWIDGFESVEMTLKLFDVFRSGDAPAFTKLLLFCR
jgi:hypothetical protein